MRPKREHATNTGQTYMITTETWERRRLFHVDAWARLLIDTLYHYRGQAFLIHEFVVMPDHIHVLMTPLTSLEKAVQFIKGGFSYRAKKELGSNMEVWQRGFQDHRIRDAGDYANHVTYIHDNPVKEHLCERAQEFPYSSAHPGFALDPVPQGLKPQSSADRDGAPKGAPLQNKSGEGAAQTAPQGLKPQPFVAQDGAAEAAPLQNNAADGAPKGAPLQNKAANGAAKAAPFQSVKTRIA